MEISERQQRLLERETPNTLLSALAYSEEDGTYFHADGTLGFALLCYPIVGVEDRIIQQLQVLLSQQYPKNTVLQLSMWTNPDIEESLIRMKALRVPAKGEQVSFGRRVASSLVYSRAEWLRHHTRERISEYLPACLRDIQVVVSLKVPCSGALPSQAEHELIGRLKRSTTQVLTTLGMAPRTLDPERYLRLMGSILNWDPEASWRTQALLYDEKRQVRDQIFDPETTVSVTEQGLRIGNQHVATFCVKRLPEYVHLTQAAQFLGDAKLGARGIRENILITLNVLFPDAEQSRTAMTAKKNTTTWQRMGPLAKYMPRLQRQKEDFDTLFDALEDGDRVVQAYLSFCLFAPSEEDLEGAKGNLLTYYRELGYRLQQDRFIAVPVFFNALPMNADPSAARNLVRYRTMAGRHAVQLMPVVGDWKGTGNPVMTLQSRNGQLMSVDLFDSQTNYSAVVAAESGSGKSFFVNFLVTNYMSLGADIYLIEVGRSFKNLCHTLRGEHLEFTADSNLSMSPFSAIEKYDEQSDLLNAAIISMVSPKGQITEYQEAALQKEIAELFKERGKAATIDELATRLEQCRDLDGKLDSRVNDLGKQLFAFTSKGEHGRWFNKPATVNFNSSFTVLELEDLKGRPHLMKVVLVQLMAIIQRAMYLSDASRPKLLIIDEGWELITSGPEGKFIEKGCRQLRKYRGAAVLMLQSVNDLYKTEVGEAIWENTANKFLLGQTPEAVEKLVKTGRLAMHEDAIEVLRGVRTEKGVFSEIFMRTGRGAGIARFVVDMRTALLYSTDPNDKQALASRLSRGLSLEDAIEDVVASRTQRLAKAS